MKTVKISFLPNKKIKITSNCTSKYELAKILSKTALEFENYAFENKTNDTYDVEYSILLNTNTLKKSIFNTSIESHPFSLRIKEELRFREIETIWQLVKIKKEKLKLLRGFGPKTMREVNVYLKELGLKFEMTDREISIYCEKNQRTNSDSD